MDLHNFELAAMSRKAPETEQLLIMFHAANDMTQERAIGVAKDLCLYCCRLQREIDGHEALASDAELKEVTNRMERALLLVAMGRNDFTGPSIDYMQGYRDGQEYQARIARKALGHG